MLHHVLNVSGRPLELWEQLQRDQNKGFDIDPVRGADASDSDDDDEKHRGSAQNSRDLLSNCASQAPLRVASPLEVFKDVLGYLDKCWSELDDDKRSILRETSLGTVMCGVRECWIVRHSVAVVPVGNRLVKASRLFFRLNEDLSPFMFEVPRAFGGFENLLKALGTTEQPGKSTQYSHTVQHILSFCLWCRRPHGLRAVPYGAAHGGGSTPTQHQRAARGGKRRSAPGQIYQRQLVSRCRFRLLRVWSHTH